MYGATKRMPGFTLIELLVVVTVIGILAVVAYPTYQDQVRKGRRADARTALLNVALAQEKFRATCNEYARLIGNARVCDNATPANNRLIGTATSLDGHYTVTIANASATTYTLTATAISTSPQWDDPYCRSLSIDQDKVKTAKDSSSANSTVCW